MSWLFDEKRVTNQTKGTLMATADHPSMRSLIVKVVQYAKKQQADNPRLKVLVRFIRLFYLHAPVNELKDRSISELYGMVYSQWRLVNIAKSFQKHHLQIFNPDIEQAGWRSTHTVIQLITEDMPFVVDSIRMLLNRMGVNIHLMIYMGGMKVCRDEAGKLYEVAAYHTRHKECSTIESPIYVEIDRQTDPSVLKDLFLNLESVLSDVQSAVEDWGIMKQHVRDAVAELENSPLSFDPREKEESIHFLKWLLHDQFTFLGMRDYEVVGEKADRALRLIKGSGLGVLRDDSNSQEYRHFSEMPELARELLLSDRQLLVISKTNTMSTVHRDAYTDYVGIKKFNDQGALIGERRIIGLYTSTAYSSHPKQIPFLRHKVASILKKSGLPAKSHAGKDLMHILETFPRDDLFQATTEELYHIALGILNLQERKTVSLFVREDAYGRYVSCLVYVPRDAFNSQLISRVQEVLVEAFKGIDSNYTTYFYTPVLTRIHYVIRINPKRRLRYRLSDLRERLIDVCKSWQDAFKEYALDFFGEEKGNYLVNRYLQAFTAGYREDFTPVNAVIDIKHIERMSKSDALGMSMYRPIGSETAEIKFKLFRYDETVPLSDALPILENMGLRVIGEQPYQLIFKDKSQLWINDFNMVFMKNHLLDVNEVRDIFQEAFYQVWLGHAENDSFNTLVLEAQLEWREVAIIRAYAKYLRQTGFTYSQEYLAETFLKYPKIAKSLIKYFHGCFDPKLQGNRKEMVRALTATLKSQIEEVALLDEDRIFSRFFQIVKATIRTNFYQKNEQGESKKFISFKLSPEKIPEMPLPLPKYEVFVYSPDFEGVHLRAGKVARGGLRWSDRREDFRTEILGLMKAQQVKNAVIVPAGAKGGFVPKNLPLDGPREEVMQEAIRCYSGFIEGLLDLTDNLVADKIVRPIDTVCYDDADAYLVVAADKGTATFSDIANQISLDRGFWLGDAFASGGSTGYDHKKMGITARGAWVSAERHFQGIGVNLNEAEVTVVGIGDMGGDVFGNGMLLSKRLKLVCAFNHLHIFIDPNPDPAISFEERKRLFELPRSTWADYQVDLISSGGGVFSRTAKFIPISPEMKSLFDIEADRLIPTDLIRAVLKSRVDLIWNGGIGTYVKATEESNESVGDRANDVLRINGSELRAKVVAEGGNLGLTQLGRIEFAKKGGLINTDFIDNSGGVDSSDHEVNIKILLDSVVAAGDLTEKQRNKFLASMTEDVSALVLKNNYLQNKAVSFLSAESPVHMNLYQQFILWLEQAGKLNRSLEYLPDDKVLLERRANNLGFTRPEISVLFSYSKIVLEEQIRRSDLVNDERLVGYLERAFPLALRKRYHNYILSHRLRNEILSTQLSNHVISQMGIAFIYQMVDETGASVVAIVSAFIAAHRVFQLDRLMEDIEALDHKVDSKLQNKMMNEVISLVRRATRWLLRNWREKIDIATTINHFENPLHELYKRLPKLLVGNVKDQADRFANILVEQGVPETLAVRIASARPMYHSLNIVQASSGCDMDVYKVAGTYFMLADKLELQWFRDKINDHPISHRWSVLAKAAFKTDLDWVQRELTVGVLNMQSTSKSLSSRLSAWMSHYEDLIERWRLILTDLRGENISDFSIISVAIRELMDLAQSCRQDCASLKVKD